MDDCWLTESRPWHGLSALRAGLGHVTSLTLPEPSLLPQALDWCRGRGLRPWPLGGGTNLVGSDRPDAGLAALRLAPPAGVPVPEASGRLAVSAGMALGRLVARTAQRGWGGLAALSGIPGTLGGALAMNAGALGREMADAVEAMAGLEVRDGSPWRWRRGDGGWGYRRSPVPDGVMLTEATLQLWPVEAAAEASAIAAERARRVRVTPRGRSCGSVFRNPPGESAGRLLEAAGCKGLTAGVFAVSEEHANWVVNRSGAPGRASDCLWLLSEMRRRVRDLCGVELQPGWRLADSEMLLGVD